MSDQWRITYSIEQRTVGDDQYREIGYGASASHDSVDAALYDIQSAIQNGIWETVGLLSVVSPADQENQK